VDNESQDGTLEVAQRYPCHTVHISDRTFSFGRALNLGVQVARGELVAILSGHCIPMNDQWLQCLSSPFEDPQVAGVYGRQEPLPDSDPFDKRDLWTTFGAERMTQRRDCFFHNANSMIRRSLWEDIPFNEGLNGLEDRDWSRRVIAMGYSVVYEPSATVHHHHGLHHGRDPDRADRVASVLEHMHPGSSTPILGFPGSRLQRSRI
jgi:GT2 family glycosyltransferase